MKPVILFNFGYNRKGWILPIEALNDYITAVYLYYVSQEQEVIKFTNCRIIYWSDYSSIKELLDDVKPVKVVMMSLYSGLGILLNYESKKRKIPTFILQHGIYSNYKDYREREIRTKRLGLTSELSTLPSKVFRTDIFYKKSLSFLDYFHFIKFPIFMLLQKKYGFWFASRWVRFDARIPDFYICYTIQNSRIHRELDNAGDGKFQYIGNPEMDVYFGNRESADQSTTNYYLLIDQPLAENRYGEHICTREQIIAHYTKLSNFARARQAILKVKLHPESYSSSWLPTDLCIEWLKDYENLPSLIKNAKGCFGYFSTLIIPAIYFNKCVLFRISDNDMQKDAFRWNLVQLLDFFTYSESDLNFEEIRKDQMAAFIEKYILFIDNLSTKRLKDILLN